ncbi:methylated-DNA--[protein]-cysteine S-methyltransferase [Bhargavaea cecembensis]|uniref:methylated-DNA--[protein]-cysteine S-methyltransferase n=1 Tax=Bhargavaea cecembensis TaxID=394098 RepID=UPI00058CA7CD|nr:methylated-DNA--[protein]-cysteine S-methyltransferase [Bhargavaea cecembensis]
MEERTISWALLEHGSWRFHLAAVPEGLCYIGSQDAGPEEIAAYAQKRLPGHRLEENPQALGPYRAELVDYLDGRRTEFSQPVSLAGTAFQQKVWEALRDIPCGETKTYSDIAEQIGRPEAVRAVAAAIGANPVLVHIPCHRVIGKNGKLTGFRGGLDMKKRLLELESGLNK